MSLWYYEGKIPARYKNRITATEGNGYYYRGRRIADSGASTEDLARIMDQIIAEDAAEQERIRLANFVREGQKEIAAKSESLKAQENTFAQAKNAFQKDRASLVDDLNALPKSDLLNSVKTTYAAIVEGALAACETRYKAVGENLASNAAALDDLSARLRKAASSQEAEKIVNSATRFSVYQVNESRLSAAQTTETIRQGLFSFKTLLIRVNDATEVLEKIDPSLSKPFVASFKRKLAAVNPEDPLSFSHVTSEVNAMLSAVEAELEERSAQAKEKERESEFADALRKIHAMRTEIQAIQTVDYSRYQAEIIPLLNSRLEHLQARGIASKEIRDRVQAISLSISSLENIKNERDFALIAGFSEELVDLCVRNDTYNDQKTEAEKILAELTKEAEETGEAVMPSYEYRPETYEAFLAKAKSLHEVYFKDKIRHLYAENIQTAQKILQEASFSALESESIVHKKEGEGEARYTKLVYFHKDHPGVATVVYALPNGVFSMESHPIILHLNGRYYFQEPNETTLHLVRANCEAIHGKNENQTGFTEADLANMSYLVLSDKASVEYATKMGFMGASGEIKGELKSHSETESALLKKSTVATLMARSIK